MMHGNDWDMKSELLLLPMRVHTCIPRSNLWTEESDLRCLFKSLAMSPREPMMLSPIIHSPSYCCECASSKSEVRSWVCPNTTVTRQHLVSTIFLMAAFMSTEPALYSAFVHTLIWLAIAAFSKASAPAVEKGSFEPIKILAHVQLKQPGKMRAKNTEVTTLVKIKICRRLVVLSLLMNSVGANDLSARPKHALLHKPIISFAINFAWTSSVGGVLKKFEKRESLNSALVAE